MPMTLVSKMVLGIDQFKGCQGANGQLDGIGCLDQFNPFGMIHRVSIELKLIVLAIIGEQHPNANQPRVRSDRELESPHSIRLFRHVRREHLVDEHRGIAADGNVAEIKGRFINVKVRFHLCAGATGEATREGTPLA